MQLNVCIFTVVFLLSMKDVPRTVSFSDGFLEHAQVAVVTEIQSLHVLHGLNIESVEWYNIFVVIVVVVENDI